MRRRAAGGNEYCSVWRRTSSARTRQGRLVAERGGKLAQGDFAALEILPVSDYTGAQFDCAEGIRVGAARLLPAQCGGGTEIVNARRHLDAQSACAPDGERGRQGVARGPNQTVTRRPARRSRHRLESLGREQREKQQRERLQG